MARTKKESEEMVKNQEEYDRQVKLMNGYFKEAKRIKKEILPTLRERLIKQ